MNIVGLLVLLLVGAICGAIAQAIVGFRVGGFFLSAVVGFIGAMLGTWLARSMSLPSLLAVSIDGWRMDLLWAILGAILIVGLVSLIQRASIHRRSYA